MKNTLKTVAVIALATTAFAATAMPTKRQLAEAQQIVKDLTFDDMRALNAKQKTPGEVAAKHLDLAVKADTEAGRYLLLQGAFRIYARSGDYDAAADVLQRIKADISDVTPEVMVTLVDGEMRNVAYSKAPKVHAIYNDARRTIKYRKRLTAAEAEAEKRGTSKSFKQLAECHVQLGNWKKALEAFAQARIPAAKWELDRTSVSDCDAFKAAEYWWNYEAEELEPFRAHAAALYRIALDEGLVTGLRSEVVKKRIEEVEANGGTVGSPVPGATGRAGRPTEGERGMLGVGGKFPIHRWSFTGGSLKDSIGGGTAKFSGSGTATFANNEVKLPGGSRGTSCLDLGSNVFPASGPVTIEIWATQDAAQEYSRIFAIGSADNNKLTMGWNYGTAINQNFVQLKISGSDYVWQCDTMQPYTLGTKYHISMVVVPNGDGKSTLSWAKRDATTGAVLKSGSNVTSGNWTPGDFASRNLWLGHGYSNNDASATYDEVRIWDCALSAEELTANAKAGPDSLAYIPSVKQGETSARRAESLYCVIDLSAGANAAKYPVSYMDKPPSGGFNVDEYKTTKLVLRRIEPGSFIMGKDQKDESHRVTLTKPFYIGVFEVTQKQYELMTGDNPSRSKGDMRPVEFVSYDTIRGKGEGAKWPASSAVDEDSFMGMLRARTGLLFDLPTSAQWEYACRAGTTSKYNNGGDTEEDAKKVGNYKDGGRSKHVDVGSYMSNAWGLYDMHGNVWEFSLDWAGRTSNGMTDPRGASLGRQRVLRGGAFTDPAATEPAEVIHPLPPSWGNFNIGFRIALLLTD